MTQINMKLQHLPPVPRLCCQQWVNILDQISNKYVLSIRLVIKPSLCYFSLQKGAGYHLDLLLVALIIGICSLLGLPWVVAATVLSVGHVQSLFVESQCTAPGEKAQFLGVRYVGLSLCKYITLLNIP